MFPLILLVPANPSCCVPFTLFIIFPLCPVILLFQALDAKSAGGCWAKCPTHIPSLSTPPSAPTPQCFRLLSDEQAQHDKEAVSVSDCFLPSALFLPSTTIPLTKFPDHSRKKSHQRSVWQRSDPSLSAFRTLRSNVAPTKTNQDRTTNSC